MSADDRTDLPAPPPGVRTTRRRGRTSPAKVAALAELGPRWQLRAEEPWSPEGLETAFGCQGPVLLDIGVGSGEATRRWALDRPEARVVAVELHRPGLAKLLTDLDAAGPANVRVAEADALGVLDALEPATVAEVRVLFPDPWPKRRHLGRRMVDRAFATAVADVLSPDGRLHLATDWPDYAEHMRTMIATEPRLVPAPSAEQPARPTTTYEQRGRRAGRTITDLTFRRITPVAT